MLITMAPHLVDRLVSMCIVGLSTCLFYRLFFFSPTNLQIMEWVTDIATISALYVNLLHVGCLLVGNSLYITFYSTLSCFFRRLCRSQLVLESIESFHFRGPSHMGERVCLQSSVNKVFSNKRYSDIVVATSLKRYFCCLVF